MPRCELLPGYHTESKFTMTYIEQEIFLVWNWISSCSDQILIGMPTAAKVAAANAAEAPIAEIM